MHDRKHFCFLEVSIQTRIVKDTSLTKTSHKNRLNKYMLYNIIVGYIIFSHPGYSFPVHHGQANGVIQVIRGHPFWTGTVTICYETVDLIQCS